MDNIKELAKIICEATQKTNYKCSDIGKGICRVTGCCAYCLTIAEHLSNNNVVINHIKE